MSGRLTRIQLNSSPNAVDLVESAKQMKEHGRNGLVLSLSVLALEEGGKLHILDVARAR
jgi:AbiV family abortive infection protein